MMAYISKIIGIILVLFIAGCRKDDEPELPVKTKLILQSHPIHVDNADSEGRYFEYSGGMIGIQKIEFEGFREAGENVFFETYPELNLPISGLVYDRVVLSEFDLPQGVYKYIRLDLYLKSIDDVALKNDVGDEILNSGILIDGTYKKEQWIFDPILRCILLDSAAVEIAIDYRKKFDFRTVKEKEIKQPECEMLLQFDLNYAFASIDYGSFEEAEISGDSLDRKIIISSNNNKDLYEILLYRLGLSTHLIVD